MFSRAGSISRTSKTRFRKVSVRIGSSATAIKGEAGAASVWTVAAAQIAVVVMTAAAAADAMTGGAVQTGAGAATVGVITDATFGGIFPLFRVRFFLCPCIL